VGHLLADVGAQTLLTPSNSAPETIGQMLAERGIRFIFFEDWQGSTRPRSEGASSTAVPGSSSSASRRCSTPSAR
jgi:hypothetical protein